MFAGSSGCVAPRLSFSRQDGSFNVLDMDMIGFSSLGKSNGGLNSPRAPRRERDSVVNLTLRENSHN
jgi:hypothetical protein